MSKPCPNCGQPAMLSTELSGNRPYAFCDNPDCGAFGLGLPLATWNSRVYPPEIQAVLEAAEVLTVEDNWSRINLMKLVVAVRNLKKSEAKDE